MEYNRLNWPELPDNAPDNAIVGTYLRWWPPGRYIDIGFRMIDETGRVVNNGPYSFDGMPIQVIAGYGEPSRVETISNILSTHFSRKGGPVYALTAEDVDQVMRILQPADPVQPPSMLLPQLAQMHAKKWKDQPYLLKYLQQLQAHREAHGHQIGLPRENPEIDGN